MRTKMRETSELSGAAVPNFLAPGACLVEDNMSTDQWGEVGNDLRTIQAHYLYCALGFYYYYISSTSDHHALDSGGWNPWSSGPEFQQQERLWEEPGGAHSNVLSARYGSKGPQRRIKGQELMETIRCSCLRVVFPTLMSLGGSRREVSIDLAWVTRPLDRLTCLPDCPLTGRDDSTRDLGCRYQRKGNGQEKKQHMSI